MADFECKEDELAIEVLFSSIPHLLSVFLASVFILLGAVVFRHLDESIANEPWCEAVLFSFSTVTTIGYGKVVPRNPSSQLFCAVYCLVGIPLIFIVFSNMGEFLAEGYWLMDACWNGDKELIAIHDNLPLKSLSLIIILHSLIGGIIFHFWIDSMPFISAVYFSFISITTIGFGDLNPNPDNLFHTLIIIIYLSTGIVVMSTLFGSLSNHMKIFQNYLLVY
uniref:Potassium channel domain-containing protein n=1 Tax=Ditylenchus dipsaci TaxID=166011 RepID=A0A915ES46_9BILA